MLVILWAHVVFSLGSTEELAINVYRALAVAYAVLMCAAGGAYAWRLAVAASLNGIAWFSTAPYAWLAPGSCADACVWGLVWELLAHAARARLSAAFVALYVLATLLRVSLVMLLLTVVQACARASVRRHTGAVSTSRSMSCCSRP